MRVLRVRRELLVMLDSANKLIDATAGSPNAQPPWGVGPCPTAFWGALLPTIGPTDPGTKEMLPQSMPQ